MKSLLWILLMVMWSSVDASNLLRDDGQTSYECPSNNELEQQVAASLSQCKEGILAIKILSAPKMKGLSSFRIFLDRKFDKVSFFVRSAYGNKILRLYDTGYTSSPTQNVNIYIVSRRISWWTSNIEGHCVRSSFYVVLSVNIKERKSVISESQFITD